MNTITDGCVHPDVVNLWQELPWKKGYIVSSPCLICSSCSLNPAPPLLPPLSMNHLAFDSLPSHLSSTVVWGQQGPVSRSQSVFRAETCSAAQLGQLAPVPTQLFPTSSQQPKVQPRRINLSMCEPASEPACHFAGQRFL